MYTTCDTIREIYIVGVFFGHCVLKGKRATPSVPYFSNSFNGFKYVNHPVLSLNLSHGNESLLNETLSSSTTDKFYSPQPSILNTVFWFILRERSQDRSLPFKLSHVKGVTSSLLLELCVNTPP